MSKDEMAARLLARAAEALAACARRPNERDASRGRCACPTAKACRCRPISRRMPPGSISSPRSRKTPPSSLAPGARALVPTGFALELPQGYEAQVRPRSGLALKQGVTVLNSPGTIDADYRGEVMVMLINLGAEPFLIRRGDRIAQLVVSPVTHVEVDGSCRARRHGARRRRLRLDRLTEAQTVFSWHLRRRAPWQRRRKQPKFTSCSPLTRSCATSASWC